MQRLASDLSLQVQKCDLEGAERAGAGLVALRRESLLRPAFAREGGMDRAREAVEVEGREAGEHRPDALQRAERAEIAVALAEADAAVLEFDFDDGAQRPRLVDALDIEQWRIAEGDRRDAGFGDAHRS